MSTSLCLLHQMYKYSKVQTYLYDLMTLHNYIDENACILCAHIYIRKIFREACLACRYQLSHRCADTITISET